MRLRIVIHFELLILQALPSTLGTLLHSSLHSRCRVAKHFFDFFFNLLLFVLDVARTGNHVTARRILAINVLLGL